MARPYRAFPFHASIKPFTAARHRFAADRESAG
jgi:hypothetical protein